MRRVAAAALAAITLTTQVAKADMRQAIADQFGIERGSFVLNFPPRPGCLPASIFTDDLKIPLKRTARDDPALDRGPAFDFSADLSFDAGAEANAGVASFFGVKADASKASDAKLEFRNAHAVEMLGPEMKKRVLADPDAKAAAERKVSPFMVSRAFEGKVSLRLTRKAGMSAEAWANLKAQPVEVKAGVHVSTGDEVVITVDDPVVFAFEVVRTNYVTTHLAPGKDPDDVRFVPIPEDLFVR